MVLDKIECGKFTVDKFFDVRYGSEKYFEYIGKEAYRALPKLLYNDDVERFLAFFETVGEHWRGITVKLKRADDVYRDAYIRAKKKASLVGGEQLWDMEAYDVETLTENFRHDKDELGKYRTLLGLEGRTYFCYEHDSENISVYKPVNGRERVLSSMKLGEWRADVCANHIDKADEDIFSRMCDDIERGASEFSVELSCDMYAPEGEIKPCSISASTINKDGIPMLTVGIVSRIEALGGAVHTENKDAVTDSLTRLYNKKYIQTRAKEIIEKKNEHAALFIMDIDNFKEVNDNFGHMYGDEVLARVAGVLLDVLADNGIAGRIGGDEFMGIIYNVKDKEMVRHILRSIRSSVEYLYSDTKGMNITCSIGAARCPEDGTSYDKLFNCADKCLYIAKDKGKNRYIIYQEELHGVIRNENRVSTEIEYITGGALENISGVVKRSIELLYIQGRAAIPEVLKLMCEVGRFDRACVYYGPDFKCIYSHGLSGCDTAFWAESEPYIEHFNGNGLHVACNLFKVENTDKRIFEQFREQNTSCFIQAILGDKDNICGYTSFECCNGGKRFTEALRNAIDYVSKLIYEVLKRN